MKITKLFAVVVGVALLAAAGSVLAQKASVSMRLSGPGAVNDSTIKAGEPVDLDIYCGNDKDRTGFSLGFAVKSPNIKTITHVADSGNGLNPTGNVKGHNAWEGKVVFDFDIGANEIDWDGKLPDLIGTWGLCIKRVLPPMEPTKAFSIRVIVPDTGTLTVDSSYFPPAGSFLYAPPAKVPAWGGPYNFHVVK